MRHEKRKFDISINGVAINCKHLIKDSVKPFWIWVCAIGCSTSTLKDM